MLKKILVLLFILSFNNIYSQGISQDFDCFNENDEKTISSKINIESEFKVFIFFDNFNKTNEDLLKRFDSFYSEWNDEYNVSITVFFITDKSKFDSFLSKIKEYELNINQFYRCDEALKSKIANDYPYLLLIKGKNRIIKKIEKAKVGDEMTFDEIILEQEEEDF